MSGRRVLDGVGVQAFELVGVDAEHDTWSEQALEESTDPSRAVPGGGDLHARRVAVRRDGKRGDETGVGVRLAEDATGLGLGDLHAVLAAAPARGQLEAGDGAGAHAAGLDLEV